VADPAELAATTVLLDFDAAIATHNPLQVAGGREAVVQAWTALRRDPQAVRAAVENVELDPAFGPFVVACRAAGVEVVVVSDGLGVDAVEALLPFGVFPLTNDADWTTGELRFPHLDRCCACSTCGTCKQAPLKDAQRRGRHAVFAGASLTDSKAALLADRLFARGDLAAWCDDFDVPFTPFSHLGDLHLALLG
jgi:2-hydroxy-3-keto-5-methylthiopentenyl-1-phosphate phosphatase